MAQWLDWTSIMSVLKCASSLRSNPFATYEKEILRSIKNNSNRVIAGPPERKYFNLVRTDLLKIGDSPVTDSPCQFEFPILSK